MFNNKSLLITLTFFFILFSAISFAAPTIDTDSDGIYDDGDNSGTVGDGPCIGGITSNCDDNCINVYNPDQADSDSDGLGNACEDNAIDFGGTGYVDVVNSGLPDIDGQELTVETWVKAGAENMTGGIFSLSGGTLGLGDARGVQMWVKDGIPKFGVTTHATSTPDTVVSPVSILADLWYHIAGVFTNTAHTHPQSESCTTAVMAETPHLDMYINGEFSNCATTGSRSAVGHENPTVSIGKPGFEFSFDYSIWMNFEINHNVIFDGVIDDVRLWTAARTGAEIGQCMSYELGTAAGCEIDTSVLKGYWRFDEGLGSVVTDSSGNGYGGVLTGGGSWVNGYPFTEISADSDSDGYSLLEGDCNDEDATVYPGASEICDGKDNDCDVSTADGSQELWLGDECDGPDADLCIEGVYECSGGVQSCTDQTGDDVEVCDGMDNNCDGSVDEGLGTTTCGIGVCERTIDNCASGQVQTCAPGDPTEALELTCGDFLDNDCDTLTDINDTDCFESDNAIDLGGTGYVDVVNSGLPDIDDQELTVEAWVKSGAENMTGGIFSLSGGTLGIGDARGVQMWVKDGIPKFGVTTHATSTPDTVVSPVSILADLWYHIAGVFTNTAHTHPQSESCTTAVMAETPHLDMYINGEFSNCATAGSRSAVGHDDPKITIGKSGYKFGFDYSTWMNYELFAEEMFGGVIDDVRLWTEARTGAEIGQCMSYELGTATGCEIDPSVLKGYWRFDEDQGSVATDSSGNGYTGDIFLCDKPYVWSTCNWVPLNSGWVNGYPFTEISADSDSDGYSLLEGDCNDEDATVYPGASEICDGKDNDCDVSTADGSQELWLGDECDGPDADLCIEGVYECSGGVQSCTDQTGDDVEVCDGMDNNCDGSVDEGLGTTTCGIGVCERTIDNCASGQVQTCAPGDPTEALELTCGDFLDNDCDTLTDINDTDCFESDNAIDLGGTGYVDVVNSGLPDIDDQELTVEAWVKAGAENMTGGIFSLSGGTLGLGDARGVQMWVKDGIPKFGVTTHATSTPDTVVSPVSILADLWYHIAGVFTNTAHTHPQSESCTTAVMAETPHLDMYINGEFSNCATTGSRSAVGHENPTVSIGKPGFEFSFDYSIWMNFEINHNVIFDGVIDDVRLWTAARTGAEIGQCMSYELGTAAGCEIDTSVLKGYWRFDEGLGSVVTDSSGNGYGGVLTGGGSWVNGYPFTEISADSDSDGYSLLEGDCNDEDATVYPGASEICDGKDNDCDVSTADGSQELWLGDECDGPDADLCIEGVYECSGGVQSCTDQTNDNIEVCDGTDNDCDGVTDNFLQTTSCGEGQCSGNTGIETCIDGTWINDTCNPLNGASLEVCDNTDNDCDGTIDEDLINVTTCGVGACSGNTGNITCIAGNWVNGTCDPLAGAVNEITANGIDDDCNSLTYDTPPNTDGDGDGYSEMQGDCDDTNAAANPGATEIPGNAIDDDCNFLTYDTPIDNDLDGDTYTEIQGDCDDTNAAVNPAAVEVINNGLDDDCNPLTYDNDPTTDDDGDGYVEIFEESTMTSNIHLSLKSASLELTMVDCDDTNAAVNPGAEEIFLNGLDDDCNAATLDSALDTDDDGDGYTENAGDCDDTNPAVNPLAEEIPNNGTDDDCNSSTPVNTVSGIGMNTPSAQKWRASMAVNVNSNGPTGIVKYFYTRQRINFISTSITTVNVSDNTATITGIGNATKITGQSVTNCNGCSFTATILNSSPDMMSMIIDNGDFYTAPGDLRELDAGNFNVVGE